MIGPTPRCSAEIVVAVSSWAPEDGPVTVRFRRLCQNRTLHPSGRCRVHRHG